MAFDRFGSSKLLFDRAGRFSLGSVPLHAVAGL
jgi:hypothetical protein